MGFKSPRKLTARERRALQLAQPMYTTTSSATPGIDAVHAQGADVASTAALDLRALGGDFVEVTGTTPVTSIVEQKAGERRTTLFTDRMLLTHSTALRLPNNRSLFTSDGDIAEWMSLGGGNWKCMSYLRSDGLIMSNDVICQGRMTVSQVVGEQVADGSAITTMTWQAYKGNSIPFVDATGSFVYGYSLTSAGFSFLLTATFSCTTVNGSPTLTSAGPFTPVLIPGMEVTGTGIAGGTTISSIASDTSLTLSANATTGATNTITFKVPANKNVDVFLVDISASSGVAAQLGAIWTNGTTRANALTATNFGFYRSTLAAHLQGTRQSYGTYVGTIRTTATAGQTEDTTSKRFVWNYFNRVQRTLKAVDTTNSWNWSTASYHQANASAANQVDFVVGISEDPVMAMVRGNAVSDGATARLVGQGIGLDSTTVNSAAIYDNLAVDNTQRKALGATYNALPGVGAHFLAWLELGGGTDTQTFFGDNGTTTLQTGLTGSLMA